LKTLVGGWEVSGIVTIESGAPVNITMSGGQGGNGVGGNNRPDLTGKITGPHTKTNWLNPSGLGVPALGAWGNLPYDYARGPGLQIWNLSLFKNFVFSEARGSQFELRLETFNTFNHGNPTGVNTSWDPTATAPLGGTSFGTVNNYFPARIIQLGGKISF
jgi:hypothetical protein